MQDPVPEQRDAVIPSLRRSYTAIIYCLWGVGGFALLTGISHLVSVGGALDHTQQAMRESGSSELNAGLVQLMAQLEGLWLRQVVFLALLLGVLAAVGFFVHQLSSGSKLQLGRFFGRFVQQLRSGSGATQASAAAIKTSAEHVAAATGESSACLHETLSAMAQLRAMVEKSLSNAERSLKFSEEVVGQSNDGTGVIKVVVDQFVALDSAVRAIDAQMQQVSQHTEDQLSQMLSIIDKISERSGVINDIVLKTEILSFNASIEAARAGEHGQGFAVVAAEVGNLAGLTGKASQEINQLIADSHDNVNKIVDALGSQVDSTKQQVHDCLDLSQKASQGGVQAQAFFEHIREQISSLAGEITSVTEACDEQLKGLSQINSAISQLTNANDRFQAIADENHSSAAQLGEASRMLLDLENLLMSILHGGSSGMTFGTGYDHSQWRDKSPTLAQKSASAPPPPPEAHSIHHQLPENLPPSEALVDNVADQLSQIAGSEVNKRAG